MRLRLFLSLLLLTSLTVLLAQQSTNKAVLARAELAQTKIDIGDQIWLDVKISAPPGTRITALPTGYMNTLEGLEVVSEKEMATISETPELLLQQRMLITSFDTGYIAIPPLPYIFTAADGRPDTAYTNDLLLHVRAFPVDEDNELRPIKPIIEEPLNWLDFWPAYLILALGGIAYLLWTIRKRQSKVAPPPPPPPPADEVALAELLSLEKKGLWENNQVKEYYSELTRILREYLEGRFSVPAMEMTTRQITSELGRRENLDRLQRSELSELLQLSDMVKFAKAEPAANLHAKGLDRVREFVKDTGKMPEPEPSPVPPTAPAPAAAPSATLVPPPMPTPGNPQPAPATSKPEEE
ncbi:hypothetical protein [Neolewinella agarilytica]|uniref:Uncharacterized protein n=1 Tax=Neolewinella agarilytica TaxID=478744 RepID=A0A1H9LFW3_9BACT|nr:hypothetical protein [Neolewinella agarilytica]SER10270.1 hypothetical protein SAMN05444359_12420 [Neolewinella agarilytica]